MGYSELDNICMWQTLSLHSFALYIHKISVFTCTMISAQCHHHRVLLLIIVALLQVKVGIKRIR